MSASRRNQPPRVGGLQPRPQDVLFGRGKPYMDHIGNHALHALTDQYMSIYKSLNGKSAGVVPRIQQYGVSTKQEIVDRIIDAIHDKGGRFLRKDDATGQWMQVSHAQARSKVCHILRGSGRRRQQQKVTTTTSTTSRQQTAKTRTKSNASVKPRRQRKGAALSATADNHMPVPLVAERLDSATLPSPSMEQMPMGLPFHNGNHSGLGPGIGTGRLLPSQQLLWHDLNLGRVPPVMIMPHGPGTDYTFPNNHNNTHVLTGLNCYGGLSSHNEPPVPQMSNLHPLLSTRPSLLGPMIGTLPMPLPQSEGFYDTTTAYPSGPSCPQEGNVSKPKDTRPPG